MILPTDHCSEGVDSSLRFTKNKTGSAAGELIRTQRERVEVCRQTYTTLVQGTSTCYQQILAPDWLLKQIFETLFCLN